jgi:geranylgeranyl pyrophosphate synthase
MRSPDEHRERIEDFLAGLELSEELGGLDEVVRYALEGGGKRIRPVVCLATTEAAGGDPDEALGAAAALELVHSFSLVHDDLPALDDDEERRGRPTVHVRFG